jgi:uncharacterized membrane protein YgaE (UPF0421/DUF939 family)
VVDLEASYYQMLSALTQDIVRQVRHMLHEETSPNSHNNQRTSLMASHSLQLLEDGEDDEASYIRYRKPSAMSAEMLEYCPIFAYLYLQRLLRAIHVLHSEGDQADMRAIADKADRLITCMFCRGLTPVQPLPQMRSRRHQSCGCLSGCMGWGRSGTLYF